MIEAVNSVLQTAPFVRASAEQISTARSFAASPERVREILQAPFISPFIFMDVNFDKAVLQIRDGETGDVEAQIPSETRLAALARIQSREASQPAPQQLDIGPPASAGENAQAQLQAQQSSAGASSAVATSQQTAAFEAASQVASGVHTGDNVTVLA